MLWLKFKAEHQLLQFCTQEAMQFVRQGDTISPNLFTAALEDLSRNFDWSNRGVSINGSKLSNLRFADDVTIIAKDLEELEIGLNELSVACSMISRLIWQKQKFFAINMSLKGQ